MRRIFLLLACLLTSAFAEDQNPETKFLTNARQLVFEGKRSGEGYFHPDGNLLIFQSEREERNPFFQMYLLDLLSGETARVSPGTGKTTCGFFQPGTSRVLFASTHADPDSLAKQKAELDFRASGKQRRYAWDYDEAMDIWSANRDGTQSVNLTNSRGYDAEGAFSPDGKTIVFCSLRGAYDHELSAEEKSRLQKDPAFFGDIYTMHADGSGVRRLTSAPGYDGGPFFSPDGTRVVWRHFDENGMIADVWTMKTDGSDKRRITDFKAMSWAPFYHPSGKYLIFTSNKLGFENFELFLVDVNGAGEPVRVTFTDGFDGLPVFSPDGKKLSWTSGRTTDHKSQIFLADWNHEAALAALADAPRRTVAEPSPPAKADQFSVSGQPTPQTAPAELLDPRHQAGLPNLGSLLLQTEISREDMQLETGWLAAGNRDGRATGSEGAKAASDWLGDYFKKVELKPLGSTFFAPFEFNSGERVIAEKTSLNVIASRRDGKRVPGGTEDFFTEAEKMFPFDLDRDFRPLAFSENGVAEGEVVFAGYGLSVPEDGKGARYNSYENLDVKDKIVLLLRYVPEGVDAARRAQLNRYSGLRYKAMMARERGAKAVLVVTGPNSPNAGDLLALTNDGSDSGSGIVALSISGATAHALLASSDRDLKDLQTALDTESPHAEGGFVLPFVRVKLAAGIEHIKKTDRNVIGWLPPAENLDNRTTNAPPLAAQNAPSEVIIVGAHYDHLGHGGVGSSLARAGEEGQVHPGADDNASGVAVVIELAASLAKERTEHPEKFRRGVVFALWSGEEIGLIGSARFCEKPPIEMSKVAAYVNFDMVGRLRENKLTMQGVGSSKIWRRELEKRNVAAGFNLTLQDDPYLPTDTTSFYPKRVPVLNFFTGSHEDYHRPTDTADKLNTEGMERIAKFAQAIVLDLASAPERPDFARVEHSEQGGGSRDALRAYLGSIPDYSTEVKGVKLSGVRGESPAEKGGLKGGDVIVEFAGQAIANIYDYTYALDAVKIGHAVKMIVERDGARVELTVTPEARK